MRIALDATSACRPVKTGVARYAIQLTRALAAANAEAGGPDQLVAWVRLSRRWKRGHTPPPIPGVPVRWFQEPLPPLLGRPDLVHGLDVRVPRWPGVRRVATVHDLFSLVSEEFVAAGSRRRRIHRYRDLVDSCQQVIAVSECTRQDFLRFHDYPPERVHVTHLGVDPGFRPRAPEELAGLRERLDLRAPFLLYVGDLTVRKNLLRLVRAYARSQAATAHELVIVGAREHGARELDEELARNPRADRIRLPGYVDDEELRLLYAGAEAFLFPTLYEGFGLPVLEAFASGTPVLSSLAGSIPEIAGEHAVLVDPLDEEALADGIDRTLLRTPDEVEAARRHAAGFTWARCARETRAVYQRLLSDG